MSAPLHSNTIYDSFNARFLAPSQVAKTFVAPEYFAQLSRRNHALIVGPRGSGKTTLLKMLQQPALEAWTGAVADEYRAAIDYTGVFIPSDVTWTRQLRALGEGKLDDSEVRQFARAAFTTHILKSLVVALLDRTQPDNAAPEPSSQLRVELTPAVQVSMVREISAAWEVAPQIPTFASLLSALTARMSEIQKIASQEAWRGTDGRNERIAGIGFLHLDYLSSVSACIETFNSHTQREHRWALLFDELEIVPGWLQQHLIDSLRSADQRILFKLSLSPHCQEAARMKDALGAMPGNDYEEISLWYTEKRDGQSFCRALWDSILEARGFAPASPEEALGRSAFSTDKDEWLAEGTAYSSQSASARLLYSVYEKDKSVRKYFDEQGIDVYKPDSLTPNQRAATLRKITPLLRVRDTYRKYSDEDGTGAPRKLRSRKQPLLYTGAPTVFEITEGNPRWFIGLISRLLDRVERPDAPRIRNRDQAREIRAAANRFRAMLRTLPGPHDRHHASKGLLSLLNRIGNFIFRSVVVDDFTADPPGSFTVDSNASEGTLVALEGALNSGAIVYVPDQSEHARLVSSLRGKRFRLTYLLAPSYCCPIRLGRSRSLGAILSPAELFDER